MEEDADNIKTVKLDIPPEELQKFLGATQEELNKDEKEPEKKEDVERVTLPKDNTFDSTTTVENTGMDLIREGVIEITDQDKVLYLKAILNDVPVTLDVSMLGGQFNITIQSRSTYDQTVIFNALKMDEREDKIKTPSEVMSLMQKYGAMTMIKSINNIMFDRVILNPEDAVEVSIERLRKAVATKIMPMHLSKWILLANGLSIFESKLYRLSEACVNKDFWNPPG